MRKTLIRTALAISLASGASGLALLASSQAALADAKVTHDVAPLLAATQKDLQAGNTADAATQLKAAQALTDRAPYDDVLINFFLAIVDAKTGDYAGAYAAAQAAAASPANTDLDAASRKQLFQLAFQLAGHEQQWPASIQYAQTLSKIGGLEPGFYPNLAIAYYDTKDIANAKKYAQMSIDAAKAAGKTPDQNMMQIIANSEVGTSQAAAEQTYEQMALQYNTPQSWQELTNAALGTKGMNDTDALYLFRLRFVAGAMQPDDYVILGTAAEQRGYPTEAVAVFQQGIASGKITAARAGAAYAKARRDAAEDERMLPSIAKSAARSRNGEQDAKLAEDYWGYSRYADAEAAARAAIAKGGLKDPSEGQMILGMALTQEGKYDEAIQTFGQVDGGAARAKAAHLWSLYARAKKNQAGGKAAATPPAAQQPQAH
jgi:hypothetical protein